MNETPVSDRKIPKAPPKNDSKKSVPNNNNRDKIICLFLEEFESLYGLALIKENFKRNIFLEYRKKVLDKDFSKIKGEGLIRLEIRHILTPLITLDKIFCRVHSVDKLKDMLDLMFGLPFSVKTICEDFEEYETDKKAAMDRYIRRLATSIEKSGLFAHVWIYDKEFKIEPNPRLHNAKVWYLPNYHTEEDLWEHVLTWYKDYAENRGLFAKKKKKKTEKHNEDICYYCKKPCLFPTSGESLEFEGKKWMCHKECLIL